MLGIAGIAISISAYVPQVIHLGRERCSAGVSTRAWTMWLVGGMLVTVVAVQRRDPVFIILQISSLASAAVILLLARRVPRNAVRNSRTPGSGHRRSPGMRAEIISNAMEIVISRGDVALLALSALMVAMLFLPDALVPG